MDVGYAWVGVRSDKRLENNQFEKQLRVASEQDCLPAAKAKPRSFHSTFLQPLTVDFFLTYHLSIYETHMVLQALCLRRDPGQAGQSTVISLRRRAF